MSVIRSPASNGAKGSPKPGSKRPLSGKYPEGQFVSGEEHDSGSDEAQLDFDNSKDYNPNEDSDGSDGAKRKKLKREDSTDVDDLLGGSTEVSEEDDDEEDVLSKFYKKRSEQKQKDEERRKAKEKKRNDEKKSKSYNKTEMRDKLQSTDKERIKEVAKKLKEESKSSPSLISSLGRIPKIAKTESIDKKSNGPSFGDMMGGLDSVKSKPKSAQIKNKNKPDLLDTFTNQSPIKPKSKSESKGDKHRSDKDKSRDKDRERDRDKDRHKSKNRDRERERDKERSKDKEHRRERRDSVSKSSDGSSKHSKSESDRPKPKLVIPEKRSHEDSKLPSPKEDAKKSPKVIKESNFLGDILGDIMKEPPKKKKRRPSDVKVSEKELKDVSQKFKVEDSKEKEKETSPDPFIAKEDSNDSKPEVENSDQLEFAEPTSDLPREVRGILVYAKGNKAKKKITWKEDRELVSIEYFELDETERCNVWKEKTFEEMKKKEAMFEKSKFGTGFNQKEEDSEESKLWRFIPINFQGDAKELVDRLNNEVYGANSEEKKVQESRELRVLKALNFGKAPTDPSEPDAGSNDKLGKELRPIPLDDLSDNRDDSLFNHTFWPVPSDFSAPPPTTTAIPTNINALLSNISSGLLNKLPPVNGFPPASGPDLSKPPPGLMSNEDSALLEAQKAAAAAFGLNNSAPAPTYPPSNGGYNNGNGYNSRGRGGGYGGHYNNDRGYNNHNRDRYNNREGKRPCKFWMDRGYCREEDRCLYPHPSR